jgi:hypothetical protein
LRSLRPFGKSADWIALGKQNRDDFEREEEDPLRRPDARLASP